MKKFNIFNFSKSKILAKEEILYNIDGNSNQLKYYPDYKLKKYSFKMYHKIIPSLLENLSLSSVKISFDSYSSFYDPILTYSGSYICNESYSQHPLIYLFKKTVANCLLIEVKIPEVLYKIILNYWNNDYLSAISSDLIIQEYHNNFFPLLNQPDSQIDQS